MSENVEIIPGRLYWSSVRSVPVETSEAIYFSTDDLLIYHPYYSDFGPLNIAQVTPLSWLTKAIRCTPAR